MIRVTIWNEHVQEQLGERTFDFQKDWPEESIRHMAERAAEIRSDEYYINMMTAWYFATALAKQYEAALPFIENRTLDVWTHNKKIKKAVESYRISPEQKAYLRELKVKK